MLASIGWVFQASCLFGAAQVSSAAVAVHDQNVHRAQLIRRETNEFADPGDSAPDTPDDEYGTQEDASGEEEKAFKPGESQDASGEEEKALKPGESQGAGIEDTEMAVRQPVQAPSTHSGAAGEGVGDAEMAVRPPVQAPSTHSDPRPDELEKTGANVDPASGLPMDNPGTAGEGVGDAEMAVRPPVQAPSTHSEPTLHAKSLLAVVAKRALHEEPKLHAKSLLAVVAKRALHETDDEPQNSISDEGDLVCPCRPQLPDYWAEVCKAKCGEEGATEQAELTTNSTQGIVETAEQMEEEAQASAPSWVFLYSKGAEYGDKTTTKVEFNRKVHAESSAIIRRECKTCSNDFRDIYYKRISNPDKYDAYTALLVTFNPESLHKSFEIYSTLEEALAGKNEWMWCNAHHKANVGFPHDCGPDKRSSGTWQWTALTECEQKCAPSWKFSVYHVPEEQVDDEAE